MLRRMLLTGLIAGIAAGSLVTLLQQVWVTRLILAAETYEHAAAADRPAVSPAAAVADGSSRVPDAGGDGGSEGQTLSRFLFSWIGNMVTGMAFAMLLAGAYGLHERAYGLHERAYGLHERAYGLHGRGMSLRRGTLWGAAGILVFVAAPAAGLPPEPPGVPVAGVFERQVWWFATVAASAAGLALLVFQRRPLLMGLGALLALAPHLFGAPHATPAEEALVPAGLIHEFVVASLLTSALFWLFLGGFSGWLFRRLE